MHQVSKRERKRETLQIIITACFSNQPLTSLMVESLKSPARRVPLAWCKVAAQKKQEEAALLPGCRILKKLSSLGWNPGHSFPILKGNDPTGRQTGGKQRKNA